jgi:hypothetical protein
MSWALYAPLPSSVSAEARRVLMTLGDYAGSDGTAAWPSAMTIAQRLHTTDRSVRRALKTLEEVGAIVRGDQTLVENIRADRRPVVWNLAIDGVTDVSDRTPTVGRKRSSRGDSSGRHDLTEASYKPRTEPTPEDPTPKPPPRCTCRTVDENPGGHPTVFKAGCQLHDLRRTA